MASKRKSTRKRTAGGTSESSPGVLERLKSRVLQERFAAIEEMAQKNMVDELLQVLYMESWYTRERAAAALQSLGPPVEEKVLPLMDEGYWYVRAMAIRVLGEVGSAERFPMILDHLQERNQAVLKETARAVVRMLERFPELKSDLTPAHRQRIEEILTHHKEISLLENTRKIFSP